MKAEIECGQANEPIDKLAKSPKYASISKCVWYYTPRTRKVRLDLGVVDAVTRISTKRPTSGTRRTVA